MVAGAANVVADALIDAGLYPDEARAMVDTWRRSYFESDGLRVLYVTPPAWVDQILPIEITPRPEELTRVFIGRIEVLTSEREQLLLEQLRATTWNGGTVDPGEWMASLGRFYRPICYALYPQIPRGTNDALRRSLADALTRDAMVMDGEVTSSP